MMQCLSGASTDQRMMLVSNPPEATYTELGAQATQFTWVTWGNHKNFIQISDNLIFDYSYLGCVETPFPIIGLVISSTS